MSFYKFIVQSIFVFLLISIYITCKLIMYTCMYLYSIPPHIHSYKYSPVYIRLEFPSSPMQYQPPEVHWCVEVNSRVYRRGGIETDGHSGHWAHPVQLNILAMQCCPPVKSSRPIQFYFVSFPPLLSPYTAHRRVV